MNVEPIPDNVLWLYCLWLGHDTLCDPAKAVELADNYAQAYRERFGDHSGFDDVSSDVG